MHFVGIHAFSWVVYVIMFSVSDVVSKPIDITIADGAHGIRISPPLFARDNNSATSSDQLSGGGRDLALDKCGTPPKDSIEVSYTVECSLWSTEIRGYYSPIQILCITIYDMGGPYGEVIEFRPYLYLPLGQELTMLVYNKHGGYDGWLAFGAPIYDVAYRELHMRVWGKWVIWQSSKGVEVVFRGQGGGSSSGSDTPFLIEGAGNATLPANATMGGFVNGSLGGDVVNGSIEGAAPANRCGEYPKGVIAIRYKIPNGPENTIIQGYFLSNAAPYTTDGRLCITVDDIASGGTNIALFQDGSFRPGKPWRGRVDSMASMYAGEIEVDYKLFQGPIREVKLVIFGKWKGWSAPEQGQQVLFQKRGVEDGVNTTDADGTAAAGSGNDGSSIVEIS